MAAAMRLDLPKGLKRAAVDLVARICGFFAQTQVMLEDIFRGT